MENPQNKFSVLTAEAKRGDLYAVPIKTYGGFNIRNKNAKNLIRMSNSDIQWDKNLIENSIVRGRSETDGAVGGVYGVRNPYSDIVGNTDYITYFDKSYSMRRNMLRAYACEPLIENCLEIICDEAVVYDDNGYFAQPNTDLLQSRIKKSEKSSFIISEVEKAFT